MELTSSKQKMGYYKIPALPYLPEQKSKLLEPEPEPITLLNTRRKKEEEKMAEANKNNNQLVVARGFKSDVETVEVESSKESGTEVLKVTLTKPLPDGYELDPWASNNLLALRNTIYGGFWRIVKIQSDNRRIVECEIPQSFTKEARSHLMQSGERWYSWEVEQSTNTMPDFFRTTVCQGLSPEEVALQQKNAFLLQPLTVMSRVTVNSIDSINTAEQTFEASVDCNLFFAGISILPDVTQVQEFIDLLKIWEKIGFLGFKALPEKFPYYTISKAFKPAAVYDYAICLFAKGTFSTKMNLAKFPFDSQYLKITVTCDAPNIVNFIEDYAFPSFFTRNDFRLGSTFDIPYDTIVFTDLAYSDPSQSNSGYQYPKICFSLKITRKSDYYIYNICLPVAFISGLTLLSMSVNEDGTSLQTSERLSITLILLLTWVAYKLVVAESLPKLSYQTYLDYYLWWTFSFMFAVALENVFYPVALSRRSDGAGKTECWILLVFGVIFLVVNALFVIWIMIFLEKREQTRLKRVRVEKEIRVAGKVAAGIKTLPVAKQPSPVTDALKQRTSNLTGNRVSPF
jgi:hypothetical protein